MKPVLPVKKVSKSKFSMYLRTLCDKELYLSLFSNNPETLAKAGIPIPLKSRPGVQLITASGREFEYDQFDQLIANLPNNVFHKSNGRANIDLPGALQKVSAPSFILQPQIEPQEFRDFFLNNLGCDLESAKLVPNLSGLRPDVILAVERTEGEMEVLPNGSRARLPTDDKRIALRVIDIKNITEANASYAAEVCLYALFLSNWLRSTGKDFQEKYFVSDRIYLWKHVEMPRLAKVMSLKEGGDHHNRFNALLEDLADGSVNYLVYMPSVRKFFNEDLPRVISLGDSEGWDKVEYHVNSKCGSCDWLGIRSWLTDTDAKIFDANPTHYCAKAALACDHLSQLAALSKGATKVLSNSGKGTLSEIVGIEPESKILSGHSLLKKDRKQIGPRAQSICDEETSVDTSAKIGGLARNLNAQYDFIVNFDSGSGLLTGIAIRGTLFSPYGMQIENQYGEKKSVVSLGEKAFIVAKDNLSAEWASLQSFIDNFAYWIESSHSTFQDQNLGKVRTQIFFWEARQYQELCNAFGRHLLKILQLPEKSQRAIAWIFPAEELVEKTDGICPNIVFIKDIINSSVRLPQKFATTLLGVAENFHHERLTPRKVDGFYLEPLGNGIPRERIFEIWKSTTGTVQMFGKTVSIVDAIEKYGAVLKAHSWALSTVTARVRMELRECLTGKAPELSMTIPTGLTQVAYDSKLWDRWSRVSAAVDRAEGQQSLVTRAEWLEASYKAIVLKTLIQDLGDHRYEFEVSDDSTEAKLEEGDAYCTIGIVDWAGFPLETGNSLSLSVDEENQNSLYSPMHSVIACKIEKFDRVNRSIIVEFRPRWYGVEAIFNQVMASSALPIGKGEMFLLDGMPYDDSKTTTKILRDIGNPIGAVVSKEALIAMWQNAAKKMKPGQMANTPVSDILWDAKRTSQEVVRSEADVQNLTNFATNANEHKLNDSQISAVSSCVSKKLSIVWGPPGTGKTDTLVALLHSVVRRNTAQKILISGPNYRTVEELSSRLAGNLNMDSDSRSDFYCLYSKTREPKPVPDTDEHLNLIAISLGDADSVENMIESLNDPSRNTIISTTAHIVDKLVAEMFGRSESSVQEIFDLVVLDECSQIPLTLSLRPLATVRQTGQVIIAGDHLQMPPIQSLEPPKGAEYLVDSIQKYLITRFEIEQNELLVNYRSNSDLVDYAKTLGYPEGLSAHYPEKKLQILSPTNADNTDLKCNIPETEAYMELLDPEKKVCALIHDDPVSSQANEIEAGIVAGLALTIKRHAANQLSGSEIGSKTHYTDSEFFQRGLGIVTPHKAQKALVVRKLISLFPHADPKDIFESVDTVERFQGGERDTIIVTFGVGDTEIIEGEEKFLLQLERTNVAVSRARAKCIILMPKSLAYHLPSDEAAAETSVAIKSYLEEFCSNRKKILLSSKGKSYNAEIRWH